MQLFFTSQLRQWRLMHHFHPGKHLMGMRHLLLIFCLAFGHLLIAQSSPTPTDGELFGSGNYRETRPIFLVDSCALLPNEEREACGQDFMVNYLYTNLRWPTPDDCVEGMVVVSWFIEEDGSISELRVVRGIHEEFDEESIRVIADLLQLYPWQPGMINDRPVRIQYNMPVRWRVE